MNGDDDIKFTLSNSSSDNSLGKWHKGSGCCSAVYIWESLPGIVTSYEDDLSKIIVCNNLTTAFSKFYASYARYRLGNGD